MSLHCHRQEALARSSEDPCVSLTLSSLFLCPISTRLIWAFPVCSHAGGDESPGATHQEGLGVPKLRAADPGLSAGKAARGSPPSPLLTQLGGHPQVGAFA